MPPAADEASPCQRSDKWRTKTNGRAPSPVAKSVASATQKTCQASPRIVFAGTASGYRRDGFETLLMERLDKGGEPTVEGQIERQSSAIVIHGALHLANGRPPRHHFPRVFRKARRSWSPIWLDLRQSPGLVSWQASCRPFAVVDEIVPIRCRISGRSGVPCPDNRRTLDCCATFR